MAINKILTNTKFVYRPAIDFAEAFYIYTRYDKQEEIYKELGVQLSSDIKEIFHGIDSKLSGFVKQELKYFFSLDCLSNIPLAFVADFKEIIDAKDLIEKAVNADEVFILNYLGGFFISNNSPENHYRWGTVKDQISLMRDYILTLNNVSEYQRQEIIQLFDSPEETRMRIIHILKSFFTAYLEYENQICSLAKKAKEKYTQLFKVNPREFLETFTQGAVSTKDENWDFKVDIYISVISQYGFDLLNMGDYRKSPGLLIIGVFAKEHFESREIKKSMDKFLKLLGDKNRIKMMNLLSGGNWYIQALAKELNITPATVHYHIQSFIDLNIVYVKKEECKVIYSLNKDMVNQYLDELKKTLIGI